MSQLLWQRKDSNDTPFRAAFSQSLPKRVSNCVKAVGGVEVGESYSPPPLLRGSALFIGRGLRVAGYVSRCISCNLYAFGPICRVSAVLLMMAGPVDNDEKRTFFYYLSFYHPSIPGSLSVSVSSSRTLRVGALSLWGNIPGLYSGSRPWLRDHRLKWALFLLPILW